MTKSKPEIKELDAKEFKKEWNGENNYKQLKMQHDSRFGDIKLLKHPTTGEIIFSKEKVATSKKEATNAILALKERKALNNPNSLNLIEYSVNTQKKLCSTHYLIKSFYQYPNSDA